MGLGSTGWLNPTGKGPEGSQGDPNPDQQDVSVSAAFLVYKMGELQEIEPDVGWGLRSQHL